MGQQYGMGIGQPRGVVPTVPTINYDFPIFGIIENNAVMLNDAGKMILQIWNEIPKYYNGVEIGEFIVMPDHIHGIITINNPIVGTTPCGCPSSHISLPYLMDCFKTITTTKYIQGVKQKNWRAFNRKLWQRSYYEHIIRNEIEYSRIVKYIRNNPMGN